MKASLLRPSPSMQPPGKTGGPNSSLCAWLITTCLAWLACASSAASLESGFAQPPPSARPWVYWFPLDGNITSNGITADLEAMQRVGIGGVLYMETEQGTPRGPAKFAGPEWRALFQHACTEAARLGLEVNMNNDAGWCGSGGPWIKPEQSMQKIVWTETTVTGPKSFSEALPQPQKIADYYRDIAVYAFPAPSNDVRIDQIAGKSALGKLEVPAQADYGEAPAGAAVPRSRIVDLTSRLGPDGRLQWEVPAGAWRILRMGHTSTGKDNHPAPIDGRGLESDKLSKAATEAHFSALMGRLIEENKAVAGEGRTLVSTHIDSWETGSQNWTPTFREDFLRLRGYDPMVLLPVITGQIVDTVEISERFLWDVRMTVNDLLLENYAAHFRRLARQHGLRLSIEAYDGVPADEMAYAGRCDEPMAEFWAWAKFGAAYSCTEMASAAHVYGRPILGAEVFTSTDAEKWLGHPGNIKELGDWGFCEGINRFVFHRYALQPWDDRRPGISMGPWGLHYERTQTWWEQSRAWHEYLARCQFLLQQGTFVADLCFVSPEMAPSRFKSPVKAGLERPGHNFDGCPPELVISQMRVRNGRVTLPGGMSYRMLVLPQVPTMTPAFARKLRQLVTEGATVAGGPPRKSPSLQGFPDCDREVKAIADEVWGGAVPPAQVTERRFGKGRIYWGGPLAAREPQKQPPTPLRAAKWVWHNEGRPAEAAPPAKRYFRRGFVVSDTGAISGAELAVTADNAFECWVNGRRLGQGDDWRRAYVFDARPALVAGTNCIAIMSENTTDSPNPAGLIAALTIKRGDAAETIGSDATWESRAGVPDGWPARVGQGGGWSAALVLGPLGMQPWGDVNSSGDALDTTPDIQVLAKLLEQQGVPPDFSVVTPGHEQSYRYIHKRIGGLEAYFVANKLSEPVTATCRFRAGTRRPEFWWPESGRMERPAVYEAKDGIVELPVSLAQSESVFVVFRGARPERDRVVSVEPDPGNSLRLTRSRAGLGAEAARAGSFRLTHANGKETKLEVPPLPTPVTLEGPWQVRFDPAWGGPPSPVAFHSLEDWSKRPEEGIRYYSGAAVYTQQFEVDAALIGAPDRGFKLDLGEVAVMAEVRLNGKDLGILWKAPFTVDVTGALRPGQNTMEVRVVNLWINRMIGDEHLPEDSDRNPSGTLKSWPNWVQEGEPSPTGRYTFTSWRLWRKDSPLQPSGLLGPVRLVAVARVRL